MKKYKALSLMLAMFLVFFTLSPLAYAAPDPTDPTGDSGNYMIFPNSELLPEPAVSPIASNHTVKAKAALLLELNSNTIVYQQNIDDVLYPASLTKIMTCMLALDYGNLEDVVKVSATALEDLHPDGSSAGLVQGEEMTLQNLLYCIMLSSANEACNVVAEYISQQLTGEASIDTFVELMNQKAAALGCRNTHFANAHGLHDENHYTTAYDLSLITRKALENQTFREITSTTTYTVPATNMSEERSLTTTNYLTNASTEYYYPNASGVKTGYTSAAGRCLISTASDGELKFLSVVLGASEEVLESGDVWYYNFSETADLFDYGFDNYAYALVLTDLQNVGEEPVAYAEGRGSVVLKPSASIGALLPKDYDKKLITTEYQLDREGGLEAPLKEGEKVGTISVYYDGTLLGQTTVETLTAISRSDISYTFRQTENVVKSYWWILPVLLGIIVLLLLILIVRASILRRKHRAAMRRRRPGGVRREGPDSAPDRVRRNTRDGGGRR